jgi:hypothetical protein
MVIKLVHCPNCDIISVVRGIKLLKVKITAFAAKMGVFAADAYDDC